MGVLEPATLDSGVLLYTNTYIHICINICINIYLFITYSSITYLLKELAYAIMEVEDFQDQQGESLGWRVRELMCYFTPGPKTWEPAELMV